LRQRNLYSTQVDVLLHDGRRILEFCRGGIFGFLINLPIVSYFEVGTMLTPNHGHAAMMGVFGMFAIAFMVFGIRQVLPEKEWGQVEKYIRVSFWGLNLGLAGWLF